MILMHCFSIYGIIRDLHSWCLFISSKQTAGLLAYFFLHIKIKTTFRLFIYCKVHGKPYYTAKNNMLLAQQRLHILLQLNISLEPKIVSNRAWHQGYTLKMRLKNGPV